MACWRSEGFVGVLVGGGEARRGEPPSLALGVGCGSPVERR
jgi:hypothetical protein